MMTVKLQTGHMHQRYFTSASTHKVGDESVQLVVFLLVFSFLFYNVGVITAPSWWNLFHQGISGAAVLKRLWSNFTRPG